MSVTVVKMAKKVNVTKIAENMALTYYDNTLVDYKGNKIKISEVDRNTTVFTCDEFTDANAVARTVRCILDDDYQVDYVQNKIFIVPLLTLSNGEKMTGEMWYFKNHEKEILEFLEKSVKELF